MTYYIFLEVYCTQELQLNCLVEYTLDCTQELHNYNWSTVSHHRPWHGECWTCSSSGVNASVYKSYSSSSSATSFQISQRTTDMQACRLVIVHTAEDVDTEKLVLIFTLITLLCKCQLPRFRFIIEMALGRSLVLFLSFSWTRWSYLIGYGLALGNITCTAV